MDRHVTQGYSSRFINAQQYHEQNNYPAPKRQVIICRALKDCISCLSQINLQCLWQADEDPKIRYPCRAGYFDIKTTSIVEFFNNTTQCRRNSYAAIAGDEFIEVPVEQYENDHHGYCQWWKEIGAVVTGVLFSALSVGSIIYILNRKYKFIRLPVSRASTQQKESIELIPQKKHDQTQQSDTESEFGHEEIMRDLERVLRASSGGRGCRVPVGSK